MELLVKQVPKEEPELLTIHYHTLTDNVREIISFVKGRRGDLSAEKDGERFEVHIVDVFYIESVDDKVFLYTETDSYRLQMKLYELEDLLAGKHFLRIQKSMLVNLMKISSVKPAMSGRYLAKLSNGEEVIISRKYVPELKRVLAGGK